MWLFKRLKPRFKAKSSHQLVRIVKELLRQSSAFRYNAIRYNPGHENVDKEEDTKDKAGPAKKADQRDEISSAKARQSDVEVPAVEGGEDSREDVAREKADPAAVLQYWGKSLDSLQPTFDRDSSVPTKNNSAVESVLQQYRRLWIQLQSNPTPLSYDPSRDLFGYMHLANLVYSNHNTKSEFEGLLRCALEIPTAIDFLIQICWGAVGHFPEAYAKQAFHHWLAGLPISPQPKNPVLGNTSLIKKQPGAVIITNQKKCARIVTATIVSRCVALDILPGSFETASSCFEHEFECLEGAKATDEADITATCMFLRACARSWTSWKVGKLPNLLWVQIAMMCEWRYSLNTSVRCIRRCACLPL